MWSPVHPALFACVDGMGRLDLWNLNNDTEVRRPAAGGRASPEPRHGRAGGGAARLPPPGLPPRPQGARRGGQGTAGPGREGPGRAGPVPLPGGAGPPPSALPASAPLPAGAGGGPARRAAALSGRGRLLPPLRPAPRLALPSLERAPSSPVLGRPHLRPMPRGAQSSAPAPSRTRCAARFSPSPKGIACDFLPSPSFSSLKFAQIAVRLKRRNPRVSVRRQLSAERGESHTFTPR